MKLWVKITGKKDVYHNLLKFLCVMEIIISRVYCLGQLPRGVNADEAMGAVEAFSLSLYGTDRFGTLFPVHFRAWSLSQMSVGMAYLQAICIKMFGFSTTSIRIPAMLLSLMGLFVLYKICKKYMGEGCALAIVWITSITPWHLIQSRWAMDCNALPHVFLTALFVLLMGVETQKKRYLYCSMVLFGSTFYCYGVASYSVPLFLLTFGLYLLKKEKIEFSDLGICIGIFSMVVLPEVIVLLINVMKWPTIHTPVITMEFFPDSYRSADILFSNFSFEQLIINIKSIIRVLFLQPYEGGHNNMPKYGTLYMWSTPLGCIGLLALLINRKKWKPVFRVGVILYFLTGLWIGLITKEVNVNRLNFIFYPWLILVGIGIWTIGEFAKTISVKLKFNRKVTDYFKKGVIGTLIGIYLIGGVAFFRLYFLKYEMIEGDKTFYANYLDAIKALDEEEYDVLYISAYSGNNANISVTEILTDYILKLDPLYMQGKKELEDDSEKLPYIERYHYFYTWEENEVEMIRKEVMKNREVILMVHESELELVDMDYIVLKNINSYYFLTNTRRDSNE